MSIRYEYKGRYTLKKEKISIVDFLKTRMAIIVSLMVVVIAFFMVLSYLAINNDYKSRVLINTLGKQRMYSQVMAKNATRIYTIMNSLESGEPLQSREVLLGKIEASKKELISSKEEFDKVFQSTKAGYIDHSGRNIYFNNSLNELGDTIDETDELWTKFKEAVDVILTENKVSNKVVQALIFINENNDKLLMDSDKITDILVNSSRKTEIRSVQMVVGFASLSVIAVILVLINIYKYLFRPLEELYSGIANIGLSNSSLKITSKKEVAPVITEVNDIFLKLKRLISLIENINKSDSFTEILNYIYVNFSNFIPYSHIGIAIIDEDEGTIKASFGISDDKVGNLPERLSKMRIKLSETSLGKVIETGEARVINDLEEYTDGKPMKLYNRHILECGIKSSITLPLTVNKRTVGVIFFSSMEKNIYRKEHVEFLKTLANSIALSFEKSIFVDNLVYANTMSLAKLVESRDNDTGDHLRRMQMYSRLIAELLSQEDKFEDIVDLKYIDDIERFSPLHDIGKVAIRDEILLKPGKLTDEEFEIMKTHAIYGARVLKAAEESVNKDGRQLFKMGIEIAEGHHEKWDGTGYPYGKKGEEIPLSARIVAVADVLDALTSERPYKKAWTFEEAIDLIKENMGKHFDPYIIDVILNNREKVVWMYNSFK